MIINLRGTSGSGKTTVFRHFLSLCDSTENILPTGKKKPEAVKCVYKGQTVYVLGSYESTCGGCDTVSSQDQVCDLIDKYSLEGHVMFEGLMISHIYERYASRARNDPDNWVFMFLETPFDTCIEHIRKRRRERGVSDELADSVFKNARRTYDSTYRIRTKLTAEGLTWEEIPMENRLTVFEDTLDFYLGG